MEESESQFCFIRYSNTVNSSRFSLKSHNVNILIISFRDILANISTG